MSLILEYRNASQSSFPTWMNLTISELQRTAVIFFHQNGKASLSSLFLKFVGVFDNFFYGSFHILVFEAAKIVILLIRRVY